MRTLNTDELIRKDRIIRYLEVAQVIFDEWSNQESSVDGDVNDREPIIAIAAMLQVEDNK
jgi:hypothetical protein